MLVQAEVSLYPLEVQDPLPGILAFVRLMDRPGLRIDPGPMSTLISGEGTEVFAALREAWEATAPERRQVLVVKIMNGRPDP